MRASTFPTVIVRGGGDLATGAAWRLYRCGFHVAVLELPHPLVIRRSVAFASAIFEGEWVVEGVSAVRVREVSPPPWNGFVPITVDADGGTLRAVSPHVVVDARMTKRANDTTLGDAPLVVGLGPGFEVDVNCHRVVETQRGHYLGKVYNHGRARPDTGLPGRLGGAAAQRLLRAPADGAFEAAVTLGERVRKGQVVGRVGDRVVRSALAGVVRGLIYDGTLVPAGLKVADVDPRAPEEVDLRTISDKARAVGGGVVEAILSVMRESCSHARRA